MVALAAHAAGEELVVPAPHALELAVAEAIGVHDHLAVGAALHDHAGRLAVEVRERDLVARGVVVVVEHVLGRGARDPRRRADVFAGESVDDRKVFGAVLDASVWIAEVGRERRGLGDHLGLSVAVEVGHDERRVPDAHLDVPAEVAPPEEASGGRVCLELVRVLRGLPHEVPRVGAAGWGLDDVVVRAVAVEVAHGHGRHCGVCVRQREAHARDAADLLAAHGREALAVEGVLGRAVGEARQEEVGRLDDGRRIDLLRAAACAPPEVEADVCGVALEETPRDVRAARRDGRDESAVQLLARTFRKASLDVAVGMDGEAVGELERLALLEREGARVDGRGVDHPLVRPHIEARGGRRGHLRERHALADRGVGEVEVLRLRARDGGGRLAAGEAAHAECVRGGLREAQGRARVSAAPLAGRHAAVRRRAVERHVLLRGEDVADVDRVAAVRVGRVDLHRAILHERRILRGARAVLDVQLHHAVEAVARDRLLRHARASLRLRSGALRVGRFPVVDAVDEFPREPVSEVPDVVLRAHVGERLAGRQV